MPEIQQINTGVTSGSSSDASKKYGFNPEKVNTMLNNLNNDYNSLYDILTNNMDSFITSFANVWTSTADRVYFEKGVVPAGNALIDMLNDIFQELSLKYNSNGKEWSSASGNAFSELEFEKKPSGTLTNKVKDMLEDGTVIYDIKKVGQESGAGEVASILLEMKSAVDEIYDRVESYSELDYGFIGGTQNAMYKSAVDYIVSSISSYVSKIEELFISHISDDFLEIYKLMQRGSAAASGGTGYEHNTPVDGRWHEAIY